MNRGCSPAIVLGLLIAVASLVVEHGLQVWRALWLRLTGYNVWNLPRPGIEPMSPAFRVDSSPLDPQGKSSAEPLYALSYFIFNFAQGGKYCSWPHFTAEEIEIQRYNLSKAFEQVAETVFELSDSKTQVFI